jgi:cytochrome b involved in lipid metabolism
MKKLTLLSLIFFSGVVVAVLGYGFLFSSNKNSIQNNITVPIQKSSAKSGTTPVSKVFTVSEVAKHSTKNDCYLIINKKVYNVSSFIDSHPGGAQRIISNCGTEVTGIFAAIHSNFAWDLLVKYYIGDKI